MSGPNELESTFDRAMLGIYRNGKSEAGYNATRFLAMLHEHGGLKTARMLLRTAEVSDGFTALWERDRLDLTVEAHLLEPRFDELFSDEERETARRRLEHYGYRPGSPHRGRTING